MNVVKRLLALRFKPGKGTTTTALLTLPFVVVILLFVVGPAFGLSSSATRSTATGQTSTTGQTTTGQTGTATSGTSTTGDSTTGSTTDCGTSTDQTTTDQTTSTAQTTTTGSTPTGQTSTTGQTTTDTGQSTEPAPCSTPPPCPTDSTSTGTTTTEPATTTGLAPTTTQTTTGQTATTDTTTTDMTSTGCSAGGVDANSPAAKYSVLNGTVNVATDHERIGSSAFPNYTNGAVDNYYSMAHTHVDGSPFAEGTASPADSGPIGQTAAAGNAQQPQYADARWPGDSGSATFGNQGGPYGVAQATDYSASAESEEASSSASAPTGSTMIAVPKGFNGRLEAALAKWKAKWLGRLHLKRKAPTPKFLAPAVTIPTTPKLPTLPKVTTPAVTVPGVATVPSATVPSVTVPSVTVPPPPTVSVPSLKGPQAAPSRSLAASPASTTGTSTTTDTTTTGTTTGTTTTGTTTTNPSPAPDGGSVLKSTSKAELDPQTNALVTSGESSLGLVSVGSGQIVLEGIHVAASITNSGSKPVDDGGFGFGTGTDTTGTTTTGATTTSPIPGVRSNSATYKVSVRVAAASIGGVPVTIDEDGVHVAGQGSALPYQQASDALNSALAQAGIRISLVGPEITTKDGEETIDATGVHVYFTQPINAPGAPSQFAEHILGEVYVDSLAVLAQPLQAPGFGDSSSQLGGGKTKPGAATKSKAGTPAKGGGTGTAATHSAGTPISGSTSSGAFPSSGSEISGSVQPEASSSFGSPSLPASPTGGSAQAAPSGFVSAVKKPVWLLIGFLIWLGLSGATGWSLWKWRREGAS